MRFKPLSSSLALSNVHTLGHPYPVDEIEPIEQKVNQLSKDLVEPQRTYQNLIERYDFVDPSDPAEFTEKFPKMQAYERSAWKRSRAAVSRIKRDLIPLQRKLKWMKMSRELDWPEVNENDILDLSEKLNEPPSIAADKFMDHRIERFYPAYIFQKAMFDFIHYRTFVHTGQIEKFKDLPRKEKEKWLDAVVDEEDLRWGNGKAPHLDFVIQRIAKFEILKADVKKSEKDYIIDAARDHIGWSTIKWTPDAIEALVDGDAVPGTYDLYSDVVSDPNTMDGFFDFFKKILSPFEKLVISPFMKLFNSVVSPALSKVLPGYLHEPLAGLTQASANVLAGKIDKKNLRKAVNSSIKLTRGLARVTTRSVVIVPQLAMKHVGSVRSLDKYTGGLITSATNLAALPNDVVVGRKIDVKERVFDGVKVGLAVVSGGTAVAAMTAANVVTAKTGIADNSIGRVVMTSAQLVAAGNVSGGFPNLLKSAAQKEAERRVKMEIVEEGVKRGIVSQSVGMGIIGAVQATGGGIIENQSIGQIATQIVEQNKKTVAKNVLLQTGLGNSTVGTLVAGSGVDAAFDNSQMTTEEAFGTSLLDATETEALRRVNRKLEPYGIKANDLSVMNKEQLDEIVEDIKTFNQDDLNRLIEDGEQKMREKIEEERRQAEQKIEEERRKIEEEIRKAEEFDLEQEADELQRKAEKRIEQEQKRLNKNIEKIQNDYNQGLQRIGQEIENFDPNEAINKSINRLNDKVLAEKDRFYANWMNNVMGLTSKYGPDFLMFLMQKYGPRADYPVGPEDYEQFKTWKPKPTERLYPGYDWGRTLKMVGYGSIGLLAAWILLGDN